MNDDDLRRRFAELKRRDHAPSFERVIAKRPRSRAPLYGFLAAAAAFLLWCGAGLTERSATPRSASRPPLRVEAAAALPLDFLLDDATATSAVNLDADPLRGLTP